MSWHRLPARTLRLGAGDADRRCHNLVRGRASSHIAAAEDKRKPIVFGGYRKEAQCFWWLQQGFGIYGCSCRALFPRGEMLLVRPAEGNRAEQMQCGDCNGIKNRIQYLTRKTPSLRGALRPLSAEERKDWMAKNGKLVGEDLAKVLHQTCAQSSVTRQMAEFKADGEFVDFDVAEEKG
mgnify:CR=1 FL=1